MLQMMPRINNRTAAKSFVRRVALSSALLLPALKIKSHTHLTQAKAVGHALVRTVEGSSADLGNIQLGIRRTLKENNLSDIDWSNAGTNHCERNPRDPKSKHQTAT